MSEMLGLPTVEAVARAIHGADCCEMTDPRPEVDDARRVLALFEAALPRIKAEALREQAERFRKVPDPVGRLALPASSVADIIDARADEVECEVWR